MQIVTKRWIVTTKDAEGKPVFLKGSHGKKKSYSKFFSEALVYNSVSGAAVAAHHHNMKVVEVQLAMELWND